MSKVEVYSRPHCGYCVHAKRLLTARDIEFDEIDIGFDQQLMAELSSRTGGRTLPQIIINDQAIGGFDELRKLDLSGELRELLLA